MWSACPPHGTDIITSFTLHLSADLGICWMMVYESPTYIGCHLSTIVPACVPILYEKNVLRAVVLHLGLNSLCECRLNPCVCPRQAEQFGFVYSPFHWELYTLQSGPHSISPTNIFLIASTCLHMSISWTTGQVLSQFSGFVWGSLYPLPNVATMLAHNTPTVAAGCMSGSLTQGRFPWNLPCVITWY